MRLAAMSLPPPDAVPASSDTAALLLVHSARLLRSLLLPFFKHHRVYSAMEDGTHRTLTKPTTCQHRIANDNGINPSKNNFVLLQPSVDSIGSCAIACDCGVQRLQCRRVRDLRRSNKWSHALRLAGGGHFANK